MNLDRLTISVLFGTGVQHPEIKDVLDKLPQLKVLGQTSDPQKFINEPPEVTPDVVLVEMNGTSQIPEWLEALPQKLPHTQVLVCSHTREPDFLIRAMQVGIREFLPLPLTPTDLESALNRVWVGTKHAQPVVDRQGRVIVVTGHKGGVGATTVAVNLAEALAEGMGERVVLMDLGRPFPDLANFLDQESHYSITDLIQNMASLDVAFIQRILQPYGQRLAILHGATDFRDQDSLDPETLERIFTMLRSMYNLIVVDLSHWLDELFLKVVTEADMVVMLTGLSIPDLRNLKHLWPYLTDWHQDRRKIKVVINRYDSTTGIHLKDLDHLLQQGAYATLPSDYPALIQCLNQGTVLAKTAPRSKLWRSFKTLSSQILSEIGPDRLEQDQAATRKRFWLF